MEHVNVLIIGAGVSGIGAACHLRMRTPGRSFAILEAREKLGGTWDLFRYPGIRSDSDMYTFGFAFKPWVEERDIATGEAILRYLHETVEEYGLREAIRYRHTVEKVSWSSDDARWVATVRRGEADERFQMSADFLVTGTGYYDYDKGHQPDFPGLDEFEGDVVYPQHWPEHLDYKGKRVVVIGSGATAVTLVPSMAHDAAHVTMLQRSPTYMYVRPWVDDAAVLLRKLLPSKLAYRLTRLKNVALQRGVYAYTQLAPQRARAMLREMAEEGLGPDFDIDRHFTPEYDPWDQRICLDPDGDLFAALRSGSASVVTATIDRITKDGIRLSSGETLGADIIVSATGLELKFLKFEMEVDGRAISPSDLVTYKGVMCADVPNWIFVFGYTSASWTLKADLVFEYLCRVLKHMDDGGFAYAVPRLHGVRGERRPFITRLKSGYIARGADRMPAQLERAPFLNHDEYLQDILLFRRGKLDDGTLHFEPKR